MLRRTAIGLEQSRAFAALSGDFNPLHVDPLIARRLIFQGCVPHGMHMVLESLDALLARQGMARRLQTLRAVFSAPALHGAPIAIEATSAGKDRLSVAVSQEGLPVLRCDVVWDEEAATNGPPVPDRSFAPAPPCARNFDAAASWAGGVGIAVKRTSARELFPALARWLPSSQLAVLLATTRIVGMECPGLHSIFADLSVTFDAPDRNAAPSVDFRVIRSEKRMSLLRLGFEGVGAKGELTALFRPEPVQQPAIAALAGAVIAREFAGQNAIVIGGSRGLGETTAKLLALGGASVAVTFSSGSTDAARVVDEIRRQGGQCATFAFDVRDPPQSLPTALETGLGRPTHLYYFATPAIRLPQGAAFSETRFHHYCDFYVGGLARSLAAVDHLFGTAKAPLTLFYPSTVFLDEHRADAAEYVVAKAAGEELCAVLALSRPALRVVCRRLPALRTDQTGSLRGLGAAGDPVPVLLGLLRETR